MGKFGALQCVLLPQQQETDAPEGRGGPLLAKEASASSATSFSDEILYATLLRKGYPFESIESMRKCGQYQGYKMIEECGQCGRTRIFRLNHHCNLRTCPTCSRFRKNRIRRKYMPLLNQYPHNRSQYFYAFLTLSPKNYVNLQKGITDIRRQLLLFMKDKYIKERVKGGIYCIEARNINKDNINNGWNIHIHCLIYTKFLDNKIHGKCNKCKQHALHYDDFRERFYCANHKCNSTDITLKSKDSRLVNIWKKTNKSECHIDIRQLNNQSHGLNYMLKYITSPKSNFSSIETEADYIIATRHKMMIMSFGLFYKKKLPLSFCKCMLCGGRLEYYHDPALLCMIEKPPDYFDSELAEYWACAHQYDMLLSEEGPRPEGVVVPDERFHLELEF